VVGAKGFEPSTSWSRTRRASQAALRPDTSHAKLQLQFKRGKTAYHTPSCPTRPLEPRCGLSQAKPPPLNSASLALLPYPSLFPHFCVKETAGKPTSPGGRFSNLSFH
jgi:hypothetical protein